MKKHMKIIKMVRWIIYKLRNREMIFGAYFCVIVLTSTMYGIKIIL